MAKKTSITMFLGEDRNLIFTIKNLEETLCVDITGFTLSFMVKRKVSDPDSAALLEQTTSSQISISGAFDEDPDVNAQTATVTLFSGDTSSLPSGASVYELKRTTAGAETVLAYGPFNLLRGVHQS